jgi:hypothetical protein
MFLVLYAAVLYFDMPGPQQEIYFWGGFACFVIYVVEFFVKLIADPVPYLKNPADQFDILLVSAHSSWPRCSDTS